MDHATRVEFLKIERCIDLNALVAARFAAVRAVRAINAVNNDSPILLGSFTRRLGREAKRLGFTCVVDLAVWYELQYKGPANARRWQRRLQPRFEVTYGEAAAFGLSCVDRTLDLTQRGVRGRLAQLAADLQVCERTVNRRLEAFARAANIAYSLNWAVFLRALYLKLKEHPEFMRE